MVNRDATIPFLSIYKMKLNNVE